MKTLTTIALGTLLATGTAVADSSVTVINNSAAFLHIATYDKKGGEHLSDTTCGGTFDTPKTCHFSVPDNTNYISIVGDTTGGSNHTDISSSSGFSDKIIYCAFTSTVSRDGWGFPQVNVNFTCKFI